MAEPTAGTRPASNPDRSSVTGSAVGPCPGGFLRRLHQRALPTSTQKLIGLLALLTSGGILLSLTCALTLVFLGPAVLLTSPIWVPPVAIAFLVTSVAVPACAFAAAGVAGAAWVYRYAKGWRPAGCDRVDYARSRIAETASHVKHRAREYGGYKKSSTKDAAPGA
ncbi:oleosin-like [Curcuma longa]|uniref:oleosin-like n=1 Tax=Curcuma longa TaxID=136217 RepID=UPI003D9EA819